MSVILVGNGESLLGSNMGEVIDSYDTVVRFDGLNIEGYEKDVGTKTDILVLDSFVFLKYMKSGFDDVRDELYDIDEIWIMPNDKVYDEMAISFNNEFKNLKLIDYYNYKESLGYFKQGECNTEGSNFISNELYAILSLMQTNTNFKVIGMDFININLNLAEMECVFEDNLLLEGNSFIHDNWGFHWKLNDTFKTYYSDLYWGFNNSTSIILELKIMKILKEIGLIKILEVER
tara:strand:+ start:923 stop:1621 length:699 start_codon:yes stop_codon:yes gene_type:complete